MPDATYPLFPVLSFVGFILSLIPLSWHLQAWNSGTCYYMMWAALSCVNQFVNSVVWSDNTSNHAPIWCEISIRILLASSVGLPAASLCINRRLYQIASVKDLRMGRAEKLRAILIDTLLCVVFPIIFVVFQYIVQGHRFDIFEGVGCYPAIYNTLLTYFVNSMWPIIIGLISASYCVRTLCAFAHRRLEFSQFISAKNPSLTMSRYFRLMALAMCEILFTTPLAIFNIWLNASLSPIGPWISWDDTHFDYGRVIQVPATIWRSNRILAISIETTRWVAPLCAFIFFMFFGLADEAKKNYKLAFHWVMKRVCCRLPSLPIALRRRKFSGGHKMLGSRASESTTLPMYSPPPSSAYPVFDLKRPDSLVGQQDSTPLEKTVENDLIVHDPSHDSHMYTSPTLHSETNENRFSWKSVFQPSSDRRHSSYF